MKAFLKNFSVLFLTAIMAGCGSDPADTVQPRIQEMVAAKYSAYKTANNLPDDAGVLVHLQTPSGTWTAKAGLPAGADQNWHYRIASVSKTFTAASIMLLDQQGKLRIDDKLTDLIPGTTDPYLSSSPNYDVPFKSQITIRQILSHRAAIYDVFNDSVPLTSTYPYKGQNYGSYIKGIDPYHQFTLDELIGVVAANQLYYTDDKRKNGYKYSDTGYSILARIVERVSGKSYDRFIAENFLTPIGLSQTFAPWSAYDTTIPAPFLKGYSRFTTEYIETVDDNMSDQVGPGNIISTPADMGRWIRTVLSGRGPLTKDQIARMATVPAGNETYALGIGNSAIGLGHSGAHPGYMNLVAYNPQDDVSVVIVLPLIDYTGADLEKAKAQQDMMTEIAKEARRIAGYTAPWPAQ